MEPNGGSMPAGARTSDGRLWFPTQNGVAVIDPRKVINNIGTPDVVIEAASIDQVPVSISDEIRIQPSKNNLEIRYTAPDFKRPDQIRFRYKLVGLDDDWTEVGLQRYVSYSHLPPGKYTFLVSAKNGNGIWSPTPNGLTIVVLAPFYETRWFEFGMFAVIGLSSYLVWRYRLNHLRAQHQLQLNFLQQLITSQEGERKRIAGELHDSLGQRLVIINGIAKLALRTNKSDSPNSRDEAFEEISAEALAAIQDTRSISYDLRPVHLDRLGITRAIEHLTKKVSEATNLSITCTLDNIDDLLPEHQRINLYRIVQEALGNIVKYASASDAFVILDRNSDGATLTIEDNGNGFEVDGNINRTGRIGMGLRGMSERASLIGGDFKIRSAPGHGTTIVVSLNSHPINPARTPRVSVVEQ